MIQTLFLIFSFISTQQNPFCSCVPTYLPIEEEVAAYDLIFKGRVVKIDTVNYLEQTFLKLKYSTRDSGSYFTNLLVTFNVQSTLKGNKVDSTIKIMTGQGGGDCGYPFRVGKQYMVYTRKKSFIVIDTLYPDIDKFKSHDEDFFETTICDRTTYNVSSDEIILKKILRK